MVTNQPDIARGDHERGSVDAIHDVPARQLPLDESCVCPHDDADGCGCRKPRPGHDPRRRRGTSIDLAAASVVGDRWRDVEAGRTGPACHAVFVDRGYGERAPRLAGRSLWRLPEARDHVLQIVRDRETATAQSDAD